MIHILSIDDSKAVHAFLNNIFEKIECKIFHAYDGLDGISKLKERAAEGIDIILLDWEMPKLTGIETLGQIRSSGVQIPIIMLTSKNDPDEIAKALSLGANEYVMKPFTSEILLEKMETILGKKIT